MLIRTGGFFWMRCEFFLFQYVFRRLPTSPLGICLTHTANVCLSFAGVQFG
jgi:hypothetical protein